MFTLVMVTVQADRYGGSPSHPGGCDSDSLPPGPNSLFKRGVKPTPVAGAPSCAELSVISGAALGTTCGNHRAYSPRHFRAPPGMVFAVQMHEPIRKTGRNSYCIPPYKRGVTGSNPVAPTGLSSKRRCLTCGNAVWHRLLLSG